MKKKYLAILMAAVLVAMSVVGCGSSNDKKAKESDKKTTQRRIKSQKIPLRTQEKLWKVRMH